MKRKEHWTFTTLSAWLLIASIPTLQGCRRETAAERIDPGLPEIWMCGSNPWELGFSDDWHTLQTHLDVMKLYIGQVAAASDIELKGMVDKLKSRNIAIAVETGGILEWFSHLGDRTAEFSFEDELPALRRLTDPVGSGGAGGTISFLEMDGPIRRVLYPGNQVPPGHPHDLASGIRELLEAIRLWKNYYPGVQVNLITNFPNWGWNGGPGYFHFDFAAREQGYGDYLQVFMQIMEAALDAGVKIDGITIDNPFDYAKGTALTNQPGTIAGIDWFRRILELENIAENYGLKVGVIFNSENAGERMGNEAYFHETLQYIDEYLDCGGSPDVFLIQSWYRYPDTWLPEDLPRSMTNLAREAARKVKQWKDISK